MKNNPNRNNTSGILFPEANMPTPKIHITIIPNINLILDFLLNKKSERNNVKKENLAIFPPAIFSSPKKLELKTQSLFNPIILKPKIYWKITSKDNKKEKNAAE